MDAKVVLAVHKAVEALIKEQNLSLPQGVYPVHTKLEVMVNGTVKVGPPGKQTPTLCQADFLLALAILSKDLGGRSQAKAKIFAALSRARGLNQDSAELLPQILKDRLADATEALQQVTSCLDEIPKRGPLTAQIELSLVEAA